MSMGALSLVMFVWRGISRTAVRVSTFCIWWTMGIAKTIPGPHHAFELSESEAGYSFVVAHEVDQCHVGSP